MKKVKKVSIVFRLLDVLLSPIMRLVSGSFRESPQETHIWHIQSISEYEKNELDENLMVVVGGKDESTFSEKSIIFFHIPIFGGWKEYVILENKKSSQPWFVGWVVYEKGKLIKSDIHRLPIYDKSIRLLTGPRNRQNYFFAVDVEGNQIPLKEVGRSKIGDPNFKTIRFF